MKIIPFDYQGQPVQFNAAGWFNATTAAERFDKRPNDWLALPETRDYIAALNDSADSNTGKSRISNTGKSGIWVQTKRGNAGGTWLHPKLAVAFARWLDVRFAVWCDGQIDRLMRGEPETAEQRRIARHQSSAAFVLMCDVLHDTRRAEGKESQPYHFSNEALLINEVLTGQRQPINREALNRGQLDDLAVLETQNARLILQGQDYAKRKAALLAFMATRQGRLAA